MKFFINALVLTVLVVWVIISQTNVGIGAAEAAPPAAKYTLTPYTWGNPVKSYNFVRINNSTGESFFSNAGTWQKVGDEAPIPAGDYEIKVASTAEFAAVIRFDKISGRTWWMVSNKWTEVKNPQ